MKRLSKTSDSGMKLNNEKKKLITLPNDKVIDLFYHQTKSLEALLHQF